MDSNQFQHGPTPLGYQNPTQWKQTSETPVALSAPGEQDTAKYVYEPPPVPSVQHTDTHKQDPTNASASEQNPQKPRTICGLSFLVFVVMVSLIAIAVAAALGGGVGGGLAAKNCRGELRSLQQSVTALSISTPIPKSTPTTSIMSSSAASPTAAPATITVPETGCPSANGSTYAARFGSTTSYFTRICDTVKTGGDMFQISTPSWSSCMDSCAQYNKYYQQNNGTNLCAGVSYVPEWSVHPEYAYSNYSNSGSCWFKDDMSSLPGNWPFRTEVVSAIRS